MQNAYTTEMYRKYIQTSTNLKICIIKSGEALCYEVFFVIGKMLKSLIG